MIIDLSHPVWTGMPVFPGDSPTEVSALPGSLNVSRLSMTVHTGTHMDAPFHFLEAGATIDQIAPAQCVGPAVLVDLTALEPGAEIRPEHVEHARRNLRAFRKVILWTGWAQRWGQPDYFVSHPCLSGDLAQFLVDCSVHLVGVDTPSVDRDPYPAHHVLLGNGVIILENLTNLNRIGAEVFELIALPLKIAGRDGSPVRAVARLNPPVD